MNEAIKPSVWIQFVGVVFDRIPKKAQISAGSSSNDVIGDNITSWVARISNEPLQEFRSHLKVNIQD